MKYQDLFSSEKKKKKTKKKTQLSSALVVIGALRVKSYWRTIKTTLTDIMLNLSLFLVTFETARINKKLKL